MNAGVLAIDTEEWRAQGLADAIHQYVDTHGDVLTLEDQDGLNTVLRGHFARLPLRWNVEAQLRELNHLGYSFFDEAEVDEAPHAAGHHPLHRPGKPWHRECTDPARDEWFKVLRETEFHDFRPKPPLARRRAVSESIEECSESSPNIDRRSFYFFGYGSGAAVGAAAG